MIEGAVTEEAVTEGALMDEAVREEAVTEEAVIEGAVIEGKSVVSEEAVTEGAVAEGSGIEEEPVTERSMTDVLKYTPPDPESATFPPSPPEASILPVTDIVPYGAAIFTNPPPPPPPPPCWPIVPLPPLAPETWSVPEISTLPAATSITRGWSPLARSVLPSATVNLSDSPQLSCEPARQCTSTVTLLDNALQL